MSAFWIEVIEGAVRFSVYVQPKASRTEISGTHGRALKIRLTAPPVEGRANAALISFLAERLGVPRSDVTIVRGQHSRGKVIEVIGVTEFAVRSLL